MAVGETTLKRKIWSEDMTKFDRLFATAILSGALALGSGMSIAAAHHGNAGEHSTTKGKTLSEIEMRERQITAELNRKQLMPQQIAALDVAAAPVAMPQPPIDSAPSDTTAVTEMEQADVAAIPEDEAETTN